MKKSETENDATDSPHGTDLSTANSATTNTEPFATTPKPAQSGVAANVTLSDTPGRSSHLNVADEQRLYRIQLDRAKGFMVTDADVDFLLEMVQELDR